jgi:hypothetical protein
MLWSDTRIKVRLPKWKYDCEWFGGETRRSQKVGAIVAEMGSNEKSLRIQKSAICP